MTAKPLYTVGSFLRLPFGQCRHEVLGIETRDSGIYYRFDIATGACYRATKYYPEAQMQALNPVIFARVSFLPPEAPTRAVATVQPSPMWSNILYADAMTADPAPAALSASAVVGRVARVHSAANNVARGYHTDERTHDLMTEASAHASACAYELAAVVRGDLHLRLERAAWHLERGAFSATKEAAYSAWRAAMAELGTVQLTANAAVHAETKAREAA